MLQSHQIDDLITLVAALDRDALLDHFHSYRASFPVDFTDEFLDRTCRSTVCGTSSSRCACRRSACPSRRPNAGGCLLSSRPRMKFLVNACKPRLVDVRVDLRRLDVAVAEQFLHDAQVRAAAEQM